MQKSLLTLALISVFFTAHSQVVGSRSNSDLSPTKVEASTLSGGGYSGDVNVFNGTYSSTYPLGSVSTPGGLSFSLNLNYSTSYSAGESPSICSGIPYGEGWHVNMPMITVSNAAYFPFLAEYEQAKKNQPTPIDSNYFLIPDTLNYIARSSGSVQGDSYWFSPEISVPNVGSGRAIFKYIDDDDASCAVFVMNKFEKYVEARFYGDRWEIVDDGGNRYSMTTTLVTYRSPNNQRVLNYNHTDRNDNNQVQGVIVNNAYSGLADEVLNVIEPKQAYTSWYCTSIHNRNIPKQSIQFEYEKFGAFNYFQEFQQTHLYPEIADKLRGLTFPYTEDYTAYTDIFLKRVTSNVMASPFEVLDLEYKLLPSNQIPGYLLDPRDSDVDRLDSLYSYTKVFSQGGSSDFVNWNRYFHGRSDSAVTHVGNQVSISGKNPYLTSNNGGVGQAYIRSEAEEDPSLSFEHAFLESPRILTDASTLVSGDIYEVRTEISDGNNSSHEMGNGTVDIKIATGSLNHHLSGTHCIDWEYDSINNVFNCNASQYFGGGAESYSALNNHDASGRYTDENYNATRGGSVFSTHNQAIKWHLPSTDNSISTSNFFVMPNVPNHCDGVNIQIGPGNSDTEYDAPPVVSGLTGVGTVREAQTHPTAYGAYSHRNPSNSDNLNAFQNIPETFGIGLPWSMVEPLYIDQMGGANSDPRLSPAYKFWWNDDDNTTVSNWDNEPTKFNDKVELDKVEVIRYSKSPYMLKTAKVYRVNGEIEAGNDTSGMVLISNQEMNYNYASTMIFENLNYRAGGGFNDTLLVNTAALHWVYTLEKIENVPVAGWKNDPTVRDNYADTSILQTEFEYDWYGVDPYTETVNYGLVGNPGKRGRVMTKVMDQLGGETAIEYYPMESEATLKQYTYEPLNTIATNNYDPVIPPSSARDIHPSVHFITRLDENDNLNNSSLTNPLKRSEYIYDTTQIVYQTTDYALPANFRNGWRRAYSKGFAKTTLKEPELITGEQPYTVYIHHGNTVETSVTIPSIDEYLYFGKIDSIVQYDATGIISEITHYDYEYTLAHKNGYERPNFMRNNLVGPLDFDGLANYVNSREYEYADYRRGDAISYTGITGKNLVFTDNDSGTNLEFIFPNGDTIQEGEVLAYLDLFDNQEDFYPWWEMPFNLFGLTTATGTFTGLEAKAINLKQTYLSSSWGGPLEKAAFLETTFYDDLKAMSSNPEFYFHSYFIKTAKQSNKVYDNSCSKAAEVGTPAITGLPSNGTDLFGSPYVNPQIHNTVQEGLETDILNAEGDGELILDDLLNGSPLSETNLTAIITKEGFGSALIKDVLLEQSALSVNVMNTLIDEVSKMSRRDLNDIFAAQPYISDGVQIHATANIEDNWANFGALFEQNPYLSNQVISAMVQEANFPQTNLEDLLIEQGQLSENNLVKLADQTNGVADFVIRSVILNQGVVTDSIFTNVLANTSISMSDVKTMFIQSNNYPSDDILTDMMDDTRFEEEDLVEVLIEATHQFGEGLTDKIQEDLTFSLAQDVMAHQSNANPYGKYCNNPITYGRDYIETVTEYDYYEAEHTGKTEALGYQKLFGLEDVDGKIVSIDYPSDPGTTTLDHIVLKHEPSWQLFKTKTYSPEYPNAYNEEEYFYYYDQMNRTSRHVEFYDWESNNYVMEIDSNIYYDDTLVYNSEWPYDFLADSTYAGQFPLTDAARFSQRSDIRNVAFQKTSTSRNNLEGEPLQRSEYYFYDSRWNNPTFWTDSTRYYSGDPCPPAPDTCSNNDYACAECTYVKWLGSLESVLAQIPYGYCAHFVNNLHYYICPFGTDLTDHGASSDVIIGCYPTEPSEAGRELPYEEALISAFHLKQVVVQIDTIPSSGEDWSQFRTDEANEYIMDFRLGTDAELDDEMRRVSFALYPFDTLTVRTIDERNEHTQVQLEHNAEEIYTKYYYSKPIRFWNVNSNNGSCSGYGNYPSMYASEIGLPNRITVGYGRDDSLSTIYAYHPNYALDSIVNPTGYKLKYAYDDYDRLYKTLENDRLLSQNSYEYWNRNASNDFLNRTNQNYVETYLYNGPVIGNTYEGEHIRAYVDPLGRNYSTTTNVDGDSTQVHSGTIIYDNWSRVVKAHKPYQLNNQIDLNRSLDTNQAFTQNAYENAHKSRVLRNAKYGILDINDQHTVKQSYKIINKVVLGCELDLSAYETGLLVNTDYSGDGKYTMVGIEDEDGKTKHEYYNAIGQKVGTKQYGDHNGDEIVTLYTYDSYGNLTRVINPEKQETTYEYNILGQLFKETTVDAGEHKFMYNKLGLVTLEEDQVGSNGESIEDTPGDTTFYRHYRYFTYDPYGRLKTQRYIGYAITNNNSSDNQNLIFDLLLYKDTVITGLDSQQNANGEKYFVYNFTNASTYDWASKLGYFNYNLGQSGQSDFASVEYLLNNGFSGTSINEKTYTYGDATDGNGLGKIVTAVAYGHNGMQQTTAYSYNDEERVGGELITFNPGDPSRIVTVAIDYPEYNYRGSLLTMNVDVHNDGVLDFQYHYNYDDWNRLRDIYANFDSSGAIMNQIAHYDYNDALGLLTATVHYQHNEHLDETCTNGVAQTITYSYDVRDRLTNINCDLMDYSLHYDNTGIPTNMGQQVSYNQNWNGNINGITVDYNLDGSNVYNPSGPAGVFDEATTYGYTYDLVNRLTRADAIVGDRVTTGNALTYDIGDVFYDFDRIGNFKNLKRITGIDTSGVNNNLLSQEWNYKYTAGTNQLYQVTGVGATTDRNYEYDAIGNLAADDLRDLVNIDYTRASYPRHVSKTDNEIDYLYNLGDLRVYKRAETSTDTTEEYYLKSSSGQDLGILDMMSDNWTWYVNGADRVAKVIPTSYQQPDNLSVVNGCDEDSNFVNLHYYIYDHLGNTRVVYDPVLRDSTCILNYNIEYVADYYPYGKILREYSNGPIEKFLTTQHERDLETGLDYRGARFYDSDVARFLSLDPLAADFPEWSDYCYAMGNPIYFVDQNGKEPINPIKRLKSMYSKKFAKIIKSKQQDMSKEWGGMIFEVEIENQENGFNNRYTIRKLVAKSGREHGVDIDYSPPSKMAIKKGYAIDTKSFRRVGEWHTHDGPGAPSSNDIFKMGMSGDGTKRVFEPSEGYTQIVSTPSTVFGIVVKDAKAYAQFQRSTTLEAVESTYQQYWSEAEMISPGMDVTTYTKYALKKTLQEYNTGLEVYEIDVNKTSGEDADWIPLK